MNKLPSKFPDYGRTFRDTPINLQNLIARYPVSSPGGSFRVVIVKKGLEAVERRGKSGLGGSSGFEFLPERLKFSTLVGGKHRKEIGGGPPFLNGFFPLYRFIVEEEIADLDLN